MQNQEGKQMPDMEFSSETMNPPWNLIQESISPTCQWGSADLQGFQWEVT